MNKNRKRKVTHQTSIGFTGICRKQWRFTGFHQQESSIFWLFFLFSANGGHELVGPGGCSNSKACVFATPLFSQTLLPPFNELHLFDEMLLYWRVRFQLQDKGNSNY